MLSVAGSVRSRCCHASTETSRILTSHACSLWHFIDPMHVEHTRPQMRSTGSLSQQILSQMRSGWCVSPFVPNSADERSGRQVCSASVVFCESAVLWQVALESAEEGTPAEQKERLRPFVQVHHHPQSRLCVPQILGRSLILASPSCFAGSVHSCIAEGACAL